jgi:hypothetical protein
MTRMLSGLVTSVLVSCALRAQGFPPQVLPRDDVPQTGTAEIRGRVIAFDTGQPVRRATVHVSAPGVRFNSSTVTDELGQYEFGHLPAGRYIVVASKNSFVTMAYGQTAPGGSSRPVIVKEREKANNIDITLLSGSVITGRVLDEFGDPAVNARVTLLHAQFTQGQRRLLPSGGATTNDVGEFRIFGLTPGEYYLSATMSPNPLPNISGTPQTTNDHNGYAPTYYAGTPFASAAERLTLAPGQVRSDISMSLVPTRLGSVSGFAVDAQGRPMMAGNVSAIARGEQTTGGGSGRIRPDGTFLIQNLPPGEYLLRTGAAPLVAPGASASDLSAPEVSVANVAVNGDDLTGVRVSPLLPATGVGRLVFDDQAAAQSLTPALIRISAQTVSPQDAIGVSPAPTPVKDDLTFELKVPPARASLRVGVPQPWQVKSIWLNGVDVTDAGILFNAGEDVSGIEIDLTDRAQTVAGTVVNARGDTIASYVVVLFPQERSRWVSAWNRFVAIGRADAEGNFKVTSLPPGDYYAMALDHVDPTRWQDPEFLQTLTPEATRFSIGDGETKTLYLKLFVLQ